MTDSQAKRLEILVILIIVMSYSFILDRIVGDYLADHKDRRFSNPPKRLAFYSSNSGRHSQDNNIDETAGEFVLGIDEPTEYGARAGAWFEHKTDSSRPGKPEASSP